MDLSKVKLVATDMDGTLLNSKGEVSDRFFELFEELKNLGVLFVAASGRQYYSIVEKLKPIKDEIYVIAENGALTMKQDQELQIKEIHRDVYVDLIETVKKIENTQVIFCGRKRGYIENYGQDFVNFFSEFYDRYEIVDNLSQVINDQCLKIAICNQQGAEKNIYPSVKHLENKLKVKVSGEVWLDLSHNLADKGNALSQIQEKYNISSEETMAFGDYNNDLEMLQKATYSFAMKNAHKNVKEIANYITKSNDDNGVEYMLEKMIAAKKRRV
ncbi:hypothetical protein C7447_101285 [Tenacibaculum adriaticum]|uniref:Cof subfamily protein (Haloacid dehalogenase superfamily)/HAD superfamily hydrolase (TIGR01484 family) n=1 Tax=Tenacibaculum adriaticum TaxID=413713 RepID=A0A5S5DV01_9FLAO|nr:HAD family hydrolase [Tenacibaculum adriaticum]TYP99681.1 hypothetical protein C7447_101285 [Tenacibaculum adriaticum]